MWDDTYVDTGPGYEKRHLRLAQGVKFLKKNINHAKVKGKDAYKFLYAIF